MLVLVPAVYLDLPCTVTLPITVANTGKIYHYCVLKINEFGTTSIPGNPSLEPGDFVKGKNSKVNSLRKPAPEHTVLCIFALCS